MDSQKNGKKRLIPDVITPNKITVARILLIPVFVVFFFLTNVPYNYIISAAIFAIAALTDFADGHIARKYHMVSNMGKFLDPIADKVLVSTALILLCTTGVFALVGGTAGYIAGVVCVCIIMARELIISGFRQVAATAGIVLAAEKLGKYKTAFQDISIAVMLVAIDFFEYSGPLSTVGNVIGYVGLAIFAVSVVLTIVSGLSYVIKNKQVLSSPKAKED